MKALSQPISLGTLLLACLLTACPALGATREYAFSGPALTGRFIVEEFTSPTPICSTCDERLERDFAGAPYLFSAEVGGVSRITNNFSLVVYNQMVAFGRSDMYILSGANMDLVFMGPSLFDPFTSTVPRDLESYSYLHHLRLRNPETQEWVDYDIDSLVPVPVLSIEKSPAGVTLSWPLNSTRFVLESTAILAPAAAWSEVTDVVETVGTSFSVTVSAGMPARFYRLRMSR